MLNELHRCIASLHFLDPACGCGNFLIIAYRELRFLELDIIQEEEKLRPEQNWLLAVNDMCLVNVNQFYGIEIEEFPARIAQVALWLMDHLMNIRVGQHFGSWYARIPLRDSATIVCGNALRIDWETVVPKDKLSYIMGNPPFSGARFMGREQKEDLLQVFAGVKNAGDLDFVTCWFRKAAVMMQESNIRAAFVSTNSICQGQSVAIIWKHLKQDLGIHINFAYRTFKWRNESKGVAGVHCVIVGFSSQRENENYLVDEDGNQVTVDHINGYLTNAPDLYIVNRNHPICDVPEMAMGNQPIDDSNYLFSSEEKLIFLEKEPLAAEYFYSWLGAQEFINGKPRYCLYLGRIAPADLKKMPLVLQRVEAVRSFRLSSSRASTLKLAAYPSKFQTENIPDSTYIAIPQVSSERRNYIPMGFLTPDILCSDKLRLIPNATLYHFGVLASTMHMAWTRTVTGRLKSDYQYSAKIVYNNFPWPEATEAQQEKIADLAQGVLDARALYPDSSLADLYDPLTMPPELVAAHRKLDAAVEKSYGRKFADDAERVAFLFGKYSELTAGKE